jgi:hypothetical protein
MYKKKNYNKETKENKNDKETKKTDNKNHNRIDNKETKKTEIKNHNRTDNKNRYNNKNRDENNKKEFSFKDYMIKQNKITLQEIENEKKYKPPTEWIESLKVINIKILL